MIRRLVPLALVVLFGALALVPGRAAHHATFTAFRGTHRVGDMIGPNARVAAVDAHGAPTAVTSTDGRPPVVWAFELADPSSLRPIHGVRVRALDRRLWAHPACPSAMCGPGSLGPPIAPPPPPLPVDPCPAVAPQDLAARLGDPVSATSPGPGTCVWSSGRGGVEVEVGGAGWWAYLQHSMPPGSSDSLVDTLHGLRFAVRRGPIVVVLHTSTAPKAATWQPIAEEVASWAASH